MGGSKLIYDDLERRNGGGQIIGWCSWSHLSAPPFLSKLTENEWKLMRERARTTFHPEQAEMQQWLKKALTGMAATRPAELERCQLDANLSRLKVTTENSAFAGTFPLAPLVWVGLWRRH
jgi:hypothetical protein